MKIKMLGESRSTDKLKQMPIGSWIVALGNNRIATYRIAAFEGNTVKISDYHTGEITSVTDGSVVDRTDPGFLTIFTKELVTKINIERVELYNFREGQKALVCDEGYLHFGEIVDKTAAGTILLSQEGQRIYIDRDSPGYKVDEKTISIRPVLFMSRVTRLNLGDRDY